MAADEKDKAKEKEAKGPWFTPVVVAIAAGALSLTATAIGSIVNGRNAMLLEQQKFESQLILNAIETGNPEVALRNLKFLHDAKLLKASGAAVEELVRKSDLQRAARADAGPEPLDAGPGPAPSGAPDNVPFLPAQQRAAAAL